MDFVDRFPLYPLLISFVIYPVFAALVLKLPRSIRMQAFAVLNVIGLALMCLLSGAKDVRIKVALLYSKTAVFFFALYFVLVLLHYVALRLSRRDNTIWPSVAFLSPIVLLAYVKFFADVANPFGSLLAPVGLKTFGLFFVGLSYMSFRLVHLVQEVRNDLVEMPTIWEYLSFAFFVPTLSIGPINPYSVFIRSMRAPDRQKTPLVRSWLRILIGLTKYIFLGSLVAQFTYLGLLRDGHPHAMIDLFVAIPAYTLYLYCNFSGFCDMVIGVSGLLNIQVAENFDRPFMSRNFQELWSRWHITLSTWIRDLAFTPLTKWMMRRFGVKYANHIVAAALMISFLGVGIWHGKGLNFLIFGALQGLGLVTVHYYTVWLKKRLGREKFSKYRKNKAIAAIATVMTFAYFSATLFFFANTFQDMHVILTSLK